MVVAGSEREGIRGQIPEGHCRVASSDPPPHRVEPVVGCRGGAFVVGPAMDLISLLDRVQEAQTGGRKWVLAHLHQTPAPHGWSTNDRRSNSKPPPPSFLSFPFR